MAVPTPEGSQVHGYLVVLQPASALAEWKQIVDDLDLDAYFIAMRGALPAVRPSLYRGIARYPIDRWWEKEPPGDNRNALARLRIWELYGPDPTLRGSSEPPWFDPDLLATVEVAEEILGLTDVPSSYEVLRVSRGKIPLTPRTIGFDVGYWGSEHFSIIADAMVMPRWHGCPLADLSSLEPWSRRLNEHLLFPSASDATDYRDWYLQQPWGETDTDDQFRIIRAELLTL